MAQFVLCTVAEIKNPTENTAYPDQTNGIVNLDAIVSVELGTSPSPWYEDDFPSITFRIPSKDYADIAWLYAKGHAGEQQRNDDFAMVLKAGNLKRL